MKSKLVWIDMEMSGLDYEKERILEIAVIITTSDTLQELENARLNLVINQPEHVLAGMDAWCTEHHTKSGLVEKVKKSNVTIQNVPHT